MRRSLFFLCVAAAVCGAAATSAVASHEGNNYLTFAPVAGSASPDASGSGIVNFVDGRSTAEPDTFWTSSFRFGGLEPDTGYTVVLFAGLVAQPGTCSFETNSNGDGGCVSSFESLDRFAIAQLRLGDDDGIAVLQATRQTNAIGPGEIVSRGNCREPDQLRSLCFAPGR